MGREEMGLWQRVKDHLNQIPGDRLDLKKMPEKELREYIDRAVMNAVGEGGIIRIKNELPGEKDVEDLAVGYDSDKEDKGRITQMEEESQDEAILDREDPELIDFTPADINKLHLELKTFLMRHPGKWRIYGRGIVRKNAYQFTVEYDKTRDEVVQTHEETLEDRKRYEEMINNPY